MTVRTIDDIFRDFVIDGVPASGPFNPHKPDIRDTLKALLEGISTFPDNRIIRLNNANTGTANNIIVTASVAVPAAAYQVLYILNVTQENTGPVTISGAITRSLVTNTSAPVPIGYLKSGMAVLCVDTGSTLRMLSYGDMETIIAEAEAVLAATKLARDAAELARDVAVAAASDAVSQGNVPIYSTRNAVEELVVPAGISAFRTNGFAAVGDGGDALYKRVASEPYHAGKVQSDDGSWWELVNSNVTVEMFGAAGNGISDDAPAFRACRDFMVEMGGGTVKGPKANYRFESVEMASYYSIKSSGSPEVISVPVFLMLPANVGLSGGGCKNTKFTMANVSSVNFGIYPRDYSNGDIRDFELEGFGTDTGNFHGIFFGPLVNYNGVSENVTLENLFIHDVSSYGIGQNMQLDKVRMKNIDVQDTGADGIDWKVHGPFIQYPTPVTRGVFMENITVRRFGQRAGAGTPSGIGIRGAANLNNIAVYEIPNDMPGIDFVPGTALASTADYRQSASMSTLTNWYCEGADPKGTAIAVRSWSSFAVNIGQGTAKWSDVSAIPGGATPYAFDDGSHFHDVVCIPSHGRFGFRTTAAGTSFDGCRVMADKVYFDARRGNLTAGQTVFGLAHVGGSSTSNSAARYVVKNGVTLTETTDYTWGANSVTLVSPVLATDAIMVVFAPFQSVRIEALYCSAKVRIDRWSPWVSISTQAQVDTSALDVVWDGHANISRINGSSLAGIAASSGINGTPQNLRLSGSAGTSFVEIDKARLVNTPTSPVGLPSGAIWKDGDTAKFAP